MRRPPDRPRADPLHGHRASRCLTLLWVALLCGTAGPAGAAPTTQARCDDLDPPSLVRALEAELPLLLPPQDAAASPRGGGPVQQPHPLLHGQTLTQYAADTLQPLLQLARRGKHALCRGLAKNFQLVRLAGADRGHVTAYYHPILRGSRTPIRPYLHPLYRRPPEPLCNRPTADILAGALDGQGFELVYVDSPYTALNVHIEGSATIELLEGGAVNLTTDGHNGHTYVNPLKLARQDGVVPSDQPTAPGESRAHAFFVTHPDVLRSYWARDAHFVFFKETPLRGTGKFGELVAGRSVAVDAGLVPLGVALWLQSEVATAAAQGGQPTQFSPVGRVTLAQDTGAAIRGMGRVDLFVGSGPAAQVAASHTSRPGELYLILRKRPPPRRHARAQVADGK